MNNQKRRISLFLSVVLLLSIVLGAMPGQVMAAETQKLTIVHVNDVHGRVEPDEREGAIGYSRLKTKVDELREENPNLLLLNAGDTFHGTTLVNVTQGETMVDLMNEVGFDIMVPGNHDFNYGYDQLMKLKGMADFDLVGANIVHEDTKESDFDPYVIKELDNGLKVGVFGLGTDETKYKSHPDNTEGIEFLDPVETSQKMVDELKDQVDFVIALGHLGVEGTLTKTSKDVLEGVEGIDLFVDGHSHEMLNEKVGDGLLVQTGDYTRNIGVVDIEIADGEVVKKEARLIPYDEAKDYNPNTKIDEEIDKIEEINKPIVEVVVGKTNVKLDGQREDVRTRETNLGNLIADAMRESTEADIAITNGGGIRADIEAGDVKVDHILTSFPFTNTLAVIEVTGDEILQAMERGVDSYPEQAGHFPQVSGMTYKFNPDKEVGSRIVEVLVDGKPVDKNANYKLVTNDFMASGGDDYTMFEGKPFIAEGGLLSDVLVDYFEKHGEVSPTVEGRGQIVKEEEKEVEVPTTKPALPKEPVEVRPPVEQTKKPTSPVTPPKSKGGHPKRWQYVVKPGDALWKVGRRYGLTWQRLAEYNNLANPHRIYPGQVINIPF